ncbi:putative LpoB-like peptidoglycan-synthase activator [Candidatus Hepatincolaceae symbiont of Richtersius coronifer]
MKKYIALSFLVLLAACGGTRYQEVEKNSLSSTFSIRDQVNLVNELTNKLIIDNSLKQQVGFGRPTLLIDTIKNKTSEQIDTESMTDTLKTALVKSRMFSVINRDRTNLLLREREINQSGLSDSAKATQLGKLWGAKFALYGNFSSIVSYVGREKQISYKFTLIIQNIETGEEFWVDEASLNKISKKSFF